MKIATMRILAKKSDNPLFCRIEIYSMKIVFKSKLGLELVIPILIVFVGVIVLIISAGVWQGLLIILPVFALIGHTFMNTLYIVEGNVLQVKSGIFSNKKYDIQKITQISESNIPLSAPATSLDRLVLLWGNHSNVIVSPKDKEGFIAELLRINPNISVKRKA